MSLSVKADIHARKVQRTRAAKSLVIRLDPSSPSTLQTQIYEGIRRAILDGLLPPGARLMSSRALATDLGVSRTTTLLAFEQLTAEGYLSSSRGSGTFVSRDLPDKVQNAPAVRASLKSRHPMLSSRGTMLATIKLAAQRISGPPRAFRIGVPAVDLFPMGLWARLTNRRQRACTLAHLDYNDSGGLPALRQAIADHVRSSRGTQCVADQVFITAGAQRGLEFICRLLLDVGDPVWMEEPGYAGARSALVAAGARMLLAPVDHEGLNVEAMISRRQSARLVYVSPSHQFPMGVSMSLPRRLALLGWARSAEAWVLEDDYDSEFRYGTRAIPCMHGLDPDGRVIYVGSFSKTLFPALRLGFLIVPLDMMPHLVMARRSADVHPPTIDQAVLADFITEGHYERHLRRMQVEYRERVDALSDSLKKYCSGVLTLERVQTGLHAVAELHGVDDRRVFEEAYARGIELMPLSAYYSGPAPARQGLVLGFASVDAKALQRGAEKLADAIEAAQKNPGTAESTGRAVGLERERRR